MAVQLWQQILLSEPNNPEALAGVAKDYKLLGAAGKADAASGSSAQGESQRPEHCQD